MGVNPLKGGHVYGGHTNFGAEDRQMRASGELLNGAESCGDSFKVKLRNVKPENALVEFTRGIASTVSFCGKSLNLR